MKYADRIKQTTATTGTGTYTLGSASTGFQTFAGSGMSDGDEVYYCCTDETNWEVGKGVLGDTQTTLTRTEILDSSTGSAINWVETDKVLFNTETAMTIQNLDELNTANGFDLLDPDSMGVVTWDNTARKMTIAVKSGETSFHYWVDGRKYVKTASIVSAAIPDTTGTYYFYLNESGVLTPIIQSSVTADVFYKYAIVSLVYWDASFSYGTPYKEQHGHRMSSSTHEMEHMTIGARYASGFALTGLVDAQDTFTGVDLGRFYDEDIAHDLDAASSIPFLYRDGAGDGVWTESTADNKVGYKNGGSYATWNEYTGGSWQLTQADSSHDYILIFVVATATFSGYADYAKIIDQAAYPSRSAARDAIEGARKKLITDGLPSPEFCFLGVYICRRNGDLENLEDGSVYLDLRGTSSRGAGGDSTAASISIGVAHTFVTTASNSFVSGEIGYISSGGTVTKANAAAESTCSGLLVMAAMTIAAGTAGTFMVLGTVTKASHGLTVGQEVYASDSTAGAITNTAPTTATHIVRIIGYAIDADTIYFKGDSTFLEAK